MATLNAIDGTVDIHMTNNNLVNHAAQAAPVGASQYSWTTTGGVLIHAFSFADDITFNATAPLGGSVHALQAVNSYTVGGLVGDLVTMTAAFNNENYWRAILFDETTIFASSAADFQGAGDFVRVAAGETKTGSDDLFEGAVAIGVADQSFSGDADIVDSTAVLTGGADTINMREDGQISGDASGVFGTLNGGNDTIVIDGPSITSIGTRVAGDVVFVSDLEQPISPTVNGGDDTIIVKQYQGGGISGDILEAQNAALGTTTGGDDLIDASANTFFINVYGDVENLGNHTVRGGNDTLIGSATMVNQLSGDAGTMTGGQLQAGADRLTGGASGDSLFGDFVSLSGGSVVINATFTGDDVIYGGGGGDVIRGQVGDDLIDGGMGDDILDGGTQTAGTGDIVAFNTLNVAVSVDLVLGFAFGQGTDSIVDVESIRGSNRSDSLAGNNLGNQIEGLNGHDQIFGRDGVDTLIGGKGNDAINGGNGNDILLGGAGADALNGGEGTDRAQYDDSSAGLFADLQGPANNTGIAVGDTYTSIENLYGSNFDDDLRGDGGANRIAGLDGNDLLFGRNGDDILTGNAGNDALNGGNGNDKLAGGAGFDTFVFNAALNAATNVDEITDFSVADDQISLENAFFTTLPTGVLQAAAFFVGAAAHDADDRIIYNSVAGSLSYDADGNGAGASVVFATLGTGLALTNNDFLVV